MENIIDLVKRQVLTWSDVTMQLHRFGGIEFQVMNREIGHLHGHYQVDIPFSARLRQQLVESGRAAPHHLYPSSSWVTYYIHIVDDVPAAIELLRLNYDRLATRHRERDLAISKEAKLDISL